MSLGGRDCGEMVPSVVTVLSDTEYSKLSSPAESAVTMTTGGVALVQPSAGTALPSLVRARRMGQLKLAWSQEPSWLPEVPVPDDVVEPPSLDAPLGSAVVSPSVQRQQLAEAAAVSFSDEPPLVHKADSPQPSLPRGQLDKVRFAEEGVKTAVRPSGRPGRASQRRAAWEPGPR